MNRHLLSKPKISKALNVALVDAAQFIVTNQQTDGAIPWFTGQITDPWDHIEAAMGLTVAGFTDEARIAYRWLASQQNLDGSWYGQYGTSCNSEHELPAADLKQSHHAGYIATGLWHFYSITHDKSFVRSLFPAVKNALDFVLSLQSEHGDISWARTAQGEILDDALVTASCSLYKSLGCAQALAQMLGKPQPSWEKAQSALGQALRGKAHRFDRHWPSKKRFAMDWFYPVLCGLSDKTEAKQTLAARWQEFVEPQWGCRCVADRPWVTMAETAELCLALAATDQIDKGQALLAQLLTFQDASDGGFWTGYVFEDQALWPEEKTTWTAAAILLAADALYNITPASEFFHCRQKTL